jgi:hypothetical protein
MLRSSVIAEREITRQWGQGLELPFDIMVKLAAVENYYQFDDGTLLLGFFTALVPVAMNERENSVQWHFEFVDGFHDHIEPSKLRSVQADWFKTQNLETLQRARCFVGLSKVAHIMLGTRQLLEQHQFRHSRNTEDHRQTLHRGGLEIGAQLGFTIGPINAITQGVQHLNYHNNIQQFSPSGSFRESIKLSYDKVALVIDSESKQSWLVPLLSLLFHMCHRWVRHWISDPATNRLPFVEPSDDGSKVVKEAIENLGDLLIFEDPGDQETFRQLWLRINGNVNNASRTAENPQNDIILASELMNLITEPIRGSPLKKVMGSRSTRAWQRLVEKIDLTVVCANIGAAIKPVPAIPVADSQCTCHVLPEGKDLLAAHLRCLKVLAERAGYDAFDFDQGVIRLGGDLTWRMNTPPWIACNLSQHTSPWDDAMRIHAILQKISCERRRNVAVTALNRTVRVPETGVVVFGTWSDDNQLALSRRMRRLWDSERVADMLRS